MQQGDVQVTLGHDERTGGESTPCIDRFLIVILMVRIFSSVKKALQIKVLRRGIDSSLSANYELGEHRAAAEQMVVLAKIVLGGTTG